MTYFNADVNECDEANSRERVIDLRLSASYVELFCDNVLLSQRRRSDKSGIVPELKFRLPQCQRLTNTCTGKLGRTARVDSAAGPSNGLVTRSWPLSDISGHSQSTKLRTVPETRSLCDPAQIPRAPNKEVRNLLFVQMFWTSHQLTETTRAEQRLKGNVVPNIPGRARRNPLSLNRA